MTSNGDVPEYDVSNFLGDEAKHNMEMGGEGGVPQNRGGGEC